MSLKPDQVRHLADLAAIELTDDEVRSLSLELSSVLEHCQRLPVSHESCDHGFAVGSVEVREDRVDPSPMSDESFRWVWIEGEKFFAVPRLDLGSGDDER